MTFYYIMNTVSETQSKISGYFETIEKALLALPKCEDWYRDKGTGRIYEMETGLGAVPKLVYER